MTGAGSGPAGFAPAGLEADPPSLTPRTVSLPHALYLDGVLMDFPTDAEGHYESVHPVDHWVEMQLARAFGSSPSAPTTGGKLRDLQIGSRAQMTLDATNIARAALAARIATGDVILGTVSAYAANGWRVHVDVAYYNTRAPDAERSRSVSLP